MTERLDTIILLIGHGSLDEDGVAENRAYAARLAARLELPVEPCFLELADPPIVDGIAACVARQPRRVVALPLFLGAAGHQKNDVPALLNWAKARWPSISFSYGTPLGVQYPLVETLAARAEQALAQVDASIPPEETALLVVGRGSRDPDSNSDVARMARLLWEGRRFGWVESAYYSLTGPNVPEGIARCIRLGARRVVVLPYLLFAGRIGRFVGEQARATQGRFPEVEILVAEHMGLHEGTIEAAAQRYQEVDEGTAAMTCDLCKYRQRVTGFEQEHGLPQTSDHRHGMRGVPHNHGVTASLALLPPRYRGERPVSAAPMAAAPLVYDEEGRVAWEKVWGGDDPESPFCELALAGGPPHRGELLEPVPPEVVRADQAGYARVQAELLRGIQLTTGLSGVISRAPGWLGVQCESEEMALWLLRAILVENISVRREGSVLYVPAGPQFRLEGEIKNVITALAKTHHYWKEHINARPM
jgi:sirohydrochlorin cobaltochelatase